MGKQNRSEIGSFKSAQCRDEQRVAGTVQPASKTSRDQLEESEQLSLIRFPHSGHHEESSRSDLQWNHPCKASLLLSPWWRAWGGEVGVGGPSNLSSFFLKLALIPKRLLTSGQKLFKTASCLPDDSCSGLDSVNPNQRCREVGTDSIPLAFCPFSLVLPATSSYDCN